MSDAAAPPTSVETTTPTIITDKDSEPSSPQAASEKSGSDKPRGMRPCHYFAQGHCRFGDDCRFSHDPAIIAQFQAAANRTHMQPPPPPPAPHAIVQIPPGHQVFSIDVECVATGTQHNARSVAQVALVDEWCRPIFNAYIRQDKPVVSYLTELTGITKETLDEYGLPLADAMVTLRSFLSPTAILVGQSIQKDVHWLQLAEGVDYHSMINLAHLFRVWNPSHNSFTSFSQDHCAKVWLGLNERPNHDAVADAAISMSLFNMYRRIQWNPPMMQQYQRATLSAPRIPGFSARHPHVDGCCMGNRKHCTCGAAFD